jgi:mRNA-degrading endonuclease toxin of MazEF toxin-antitoxin module
MVTEFSTAMAELRVRISTARLLSGALNVYQRTPITSTIRSIPTEIVLTEAEGMPNTCAANMDNIQTAPESDIGDLVVRMREAALAVSLALGFDET